MINIKKALQVGGALHEMSKYPQFLLWKLEQRGEGKPTKVPINALTLHNADPTSPASWIDYETALTRAEQTGHGVAFAFDAGDPFWFFDLDKCLIDGQWSPLATSMCQRMAGCAVEVSQSGSGLHIFGTGAVPDHACKNIDLGLEFYHEKRFVALTGTGAQGNSGYDASVILPDLINEFFAPRTGRTGDVAGWTTEPVDDWNGHTDDQTLIDAARRTKTGASMFGAGVSFDDLWVNNVAALADKWPGEGREYDASSADAALAQHLAFWTGKNCERMLGLMKSSGLVRDKWNREDYLKRTIISACSRCDKVYNVPSKEAQSNVVIEEGLTTRSVSKMKRREGIQYMSLSDQEKHFNGCTFVASQNKILSPCGRLYSQVQFDVMFGGYEFAMDAEGKSSKKAFEAFAQSRGITWPRVDATIFRPTEPFGEIIDHDFVNIYKPANVARNTGDPGRFIHHLKKLLPDGRDREIILSYMAACVQFKGKKFYWCPLIQGCEGNGKSLLSICVEQAVGEKYTHWVRASDIDSKFNGWIRNKLFLGVEDIYIPDARREVMEVLKPMITGEKLEVQTKGVDQCIEKLCGNWILNSNYKDAVLKHRGDRRYAIFYTAQQSPSDLNRDEMGGNYFSSLYDWLRDEGYGAVTHYLETYAIPDEFNPARDCKRAPNTSSTDEAVKISMGVVEQEISEAIDEGLRGFAGGWISSCALKSLLKHRRISVQKQGQIIEALGYIVHPNLTGGRTNNPTMTDNSKPKLWVKDDHASLSETKPKVIAGLYDAAQCA